MTEEEKVKKYANAFQKGSEEWQMFADFYNVIRLVWEAEDTEEYGDYLFETVETFYNKHKETKCALQLASGLINGMYASLYGDNREISLLKYIEGRLYRMQIDSDKARA